MRVVAQAAGVSVATVELGFGTKSELLRAAIQFAIRGDGEPVAMLKRPWARRAQQASSAAELLAIVGHVLLKGQQRAAGVILAAFEAANRDPSMSALADQLRAQRAETAAWIVEELMRRTPLRDGITREVAIDTIWLLMDPHGYLALTRDRGWSAEQYEAWFTDSLHRLLLASETAPTHPPRTPWPQSQRSGGHRERSDQPAGASR